VQIIKEVLPGELVTNLGNQSKKVEAAKEGWALGKLKWR